MNLNTTLISTVKGFLHPEEGLRLYEVALEACRLGPCLEVGSYCGKSAIYLGTACREGGAVLFSVDHHRGSEEQQPGEAYFDPDLYDPRSGIIDSLRFFRAALAAAGLEETVVPIVSPSQVAARGWATPLGLVFIDGGHAYETALADYRCWSPHILAGGYLLIHDIFENPEDGGQAPYRVYCKAVASGRFREIGRTRSLGVLKRKE